MREQFGDEYLNESRPTNTLYGFVTALSVEGYGGVDGLAKRVVGIAANMKINEVSFVSLEGTTEKVESNFKLQKVIRYLIIYNLIRYLILHNLLKKIEK